MSSRLPPGPGARPGARGRRSRTGRPTGRRRLLAPLLVLALVAVPLVEIYVLIQVGHVIGALPTVALLLAVSLLGAHLLRREGSRAWRSFRDSTGSGRLPTREVADGALIMLGGALLLTPGFVSDAVGLLCVLPPTRALLRRALLAFVTRRLGLAGLAGGARAYGSRIVDGESVRRGD